MKLLTTAFLLVACGAPAQQPSPVPHHWRRLLAEQGFTGAVTGKVALERIGVLSCGAERLEVFFHSWEQTGGARHAHYRVVFLASENRYVGSYRVSERPTKVAAHEIHFPSSGTEESTITCGKNGLPERVFLDGEESPPEK